MTPATLVVAAYPPELVGLPDRIACAAVGIGDVDAAAGMAAVLAERRPGRVVLVGTCGAFGGSGLAVGDLVAVEEARRAPPPPGVETLEVVPRAAPADGALLARLLALGARRAVAACPEGVTVDDAAAERIATATGAQVEHMECFAVYRACARAGVPVAALLAVANRVGMGAREAWREHAGRAQAAAVAAVASLV